MAKPSKQQPSQETQDEALKIARGIQKPGQTKEQTKLIAQGIQKGIQQYKKQHKAKNREWDKQHKKASNRNDASKPTTVTTEIRYRQHWLPWLLLVLTWAGMAVFWFFYRTI